MSGEMNKNDFGLGISDWGFVGWQVITVKNPDNNPQSPPIPNPQSAIHGVDSRFRQIQIR
jgi:hypothetical protein